MLSKEDQSGESPFLSWNRGRSIDLAVLENLSISDKKLNEKRTFFRQRDRVSRKYSVFSKQSTMKDNGRISSRDRKKGRFRILRALRISPIIVISRSGCIREIIIFEGDFNGLNFGDIHGNTRDGSLETENSNSSSKFENTKKCHEFIRFIIYTILIERSFSVSPK